MIIRLFFILLVCLSFSIKTNANSETYPDLEKAVIVYEGESTSIYKAENMDGTFVYHIVANVASEMLPEVARAICNDLSPNKKLCDVVYNATAAIIGFKSLMSMKGVTNGYKWYSAKGIAYSTVNISTATYETAMMFDNIFNLYRIGCASGVRIPWQPTKISNEGDGIYGEDNKSCHNLPATLEVLYACSFQNLLMDGWVNNRKKSYSKSDWSNKNATFVQAQKDHMLIISKPSFHVDGYYYFSGLTYSGEIFQVVEERRIKTNILTNLFTLSRGPDESGLWYKVRTLEGSEGWIMAESDEDPNYRKAVIKI